MRLQQSCCEKCNLPIEKGDKTVQIRSGYGLSLGLRMFFGLLSPWRTEGIGEAVLHKECLDPEVDFKDSEEWSTVLAVDICDYLGGIE